MSLPVEAFAFEYAKLVRRFMPESPKTAEDWGKLRVIAVNSDPYQSIWSEAPASPGVEETVESLKLLINAATLPVNIRELSDVLDISENPGSYDYVIRKNFGDFWADYGESPIVAAVAFSERVTLLVDQWLQNGRK